MKINSKLCWYVFWIALSFMHIYQAGDEWVHAVGASSCIALAMRELRRE